MIRASLWLLLAGALSACAASPSSMPAQPGPAQDQRAPSRVLFVGNSFTYYNDSLHNHLRQLMIAAPASAPLPQDPRMRSATISGAHLAEHAGLPALLAAEPWDVVVLQGHSREAHDADRLQQFHASVDQHVAEIRDHGAQPLLFMTWAYLGAPEMMPAIEANYRAAGRRNGVAVVPVGLAFQAAAEQFPDLALIHDDERHPTRAGTYLAACVFYAALYPDAAVDSAYTAGLDPALARRLRAAARATVREHFATF